MEKCHSNGILQEISQKKEEVEFVVNTGKNC